MSPSVSPGWRQLGVLPAACTHHVVSVVMHKQDCISARAGLLIGPFTPLMWLLGHIEAYTQLVVATGSPALPECMETLQQQRCLCHQLQPAQAQCHHLVTNGLDKWTVATAAPLGVCMHANVAAAAGTVLSEPGAAAVHWCCIPAQHAGGLCGRCCGWLEYTLWPGNTTSAAASWLSKHLKACNTAEACLVSCFVAACKDDQRWSASGAPATRQHANPRHASLYPGPASPLY